MTRVLEKVERRLGEKLFLKGQRCLGPKCAHIRRGYPPGVHGKKKGGGRRRGLSEYGELLREKQKVRYLYGLDDKDIARYAKLAAERSGVFSSNLLRMLESRLDNAVFRLGLTESRRIARQVVNHGHVTVNGQKVSIPSFQVKKGDILGLKEKILSSPLFSELEIRIKKYEAPPWLELDRTKKTGTVVRLPEADDAGITADVTKIKEFYSR
jgi:small subunit ribosomal protein S4